MDWNKEITSLQDAFIDDLKGLIKIESVRDENSVTHHAPFGKGCRDALDYMLNLARRDGFDVLDIDGYAGVISYGEGSESVGVLAHLDIVPVGEGWTYPALDAQVVEGYMFGRGTVDDKGPAMASYYALKLLKNQQIIRNKKVMLILGCDEESGMQCMDYYKQHGEIPTLGFTPDADFPVIYGEKGGLHVHFHGTMPSCITYMKAGERANVVIEEACAKVRVWDDALDVLFQFYLESNGLRGRIEHSEGGCILYMKGKAAHGAMPYDGLNAGLHLLNFIGIAWKDTFVKTIYELLHDWMGKPLDINFEGAHMGFLTMNTGIISIEDSNIDILVDIRYPNDMDVKEIEQCITRQAKRNKLPLSIEFHEKAAPLFVDPNSKLVTTLSAVYREYSHDDSTPNKTIGGGTYAKKFDNFVAFGPEFPNTTIPEGLCVGGVHQANEAVCLQDLYTSIAIYTESIKRLAK